VLQTGFDSLWLCAERHVGPARRSFAPYGRHAGRAARLGGRKARGPTPCARGDRLSGGLNPGDAQLLSGAKLAAPPRVSSDVACDDE
jgi:hypothetical protein